MDIFGRKAQAELSVVKAMFVEQGQLLNGAVTLLNERDKNIARLSLIIQEDLSQIRWLTSTIEAMKAPKRTIASQPLYMNENEEDLKWQLDNHMIDLTTYQQMLKELEFENAEVSLAAEDLPESFHY